MQTSTDKPQLLIAAPKHKRNFYISYLKGWAIISIILVHLIDWSNINLTKSVLEFRELLYPAVLFFIATAGSLSYIAYRKYELKTVTLKSFRRGGELIAIYFLYNIIKLYIFDFSKEPFYGQFIYKHTLNLSDILSLHSFTAPISIILTIGILLIISPFFIYLSRLKYAKIIFGLLILVLIFINYVLPTPTDFLIDFLYAKNNITFPLILWLLPFLIGFYLSMWDFEKHKGKFLLIFLILTVVFGFRQLADIQSINLKSQMYPLKLFYIFLSFSLMFVLIFLFYFLEKIKSKTINGFLSLMRFLGDSTLEIYIYHWIVIDLTIWLMYPQIKYILYSVPLFILIYSIIKRRKLIAYYRSSITR